MIYHDQTFETIAVAPVKRSNVEVAMQNQDPYGFFDAGVKWTSGDLLMTVGIDAVGSFLGTATKKATVKLLGIVSTTKAGDLFQIRLGLYNNDPSVSGFNNISEGFYIVDKVDYDYDAGSTTVTMYDHMWTASQTPYTATDFTYPCTVATLARQVASKLGIGLVPSFDGMPNALFSIPSDPYANISNATLQTVIQEIAAASGTTARISDTTLVFSQFSVDNENLTSDQLKKLSIGNKYGPVTSVVLGRVPQNDNIFLANSSSNTNTISDIDTTTNLFTIAANGMTDGTLVQIDSDTTLPAPLQAETNYFVYTNSDTDTFSLAPTYGDALGGTNLIDLTTAGSGTITLSQLKLQEVQINNIQILDNDRQTLLPPLYESLLGVTWNESKADTVGLGWHEVGDVIQYTQGAITVQSFLSEVHVTLAGSVQESLVSVIPDAETINYQTAGGILKTIYDTEIKVDKQNNNITSLVSQQQIYADETLQSFTEVYQTIDNVTTTIQSVGGGNMILNSVGYAKETDGSLSFWSKSGTGVVTSYSSAVSLSAGALSGSAIELVGDSAQIVQRVPVSNTANYSVGFRVNKAVGDGSAQLVLSNDVTNFVIDVPLANGYVWEELKLENISPAQNYWDIKLVVTGTTEKIEITDLRLLLGPTLSQWQQSQSEILNAQVALTTEGIRVSSSVHPGDYTVMTPLEFKGYSDASGTSKAVFWLNRDTTRTERVSVNSSVDYGMSVDGTGGVIRTVVVTSGSRPGIAFVGAVS